MRSVIGQGKKGMHKNISKSSVYDNIASKIKRITL